MSLGAPLNGVTLPVRILFPVSALLLLLLGSARSDDLSDSQAESLKAIRRSLDVVDELAEQEIITPGEAAKARAFYLDRATQVVGHPLTEDQLTALMGGREKTVGFGLFLNTLIVLAAVVLLLAVIGLATYYLWPVLIRLPVVYYEAAAWLAVVVVLLGGWLWPPFRVWFLYIQPLWFVLPAALGLIGTVSLSYRLHRPKREDDGDRVYFGPGWVSFPVVLFGVCAVVWGAGAVFYHDLFPNAAIPHVLAFLAVIAFQALLGFSVVTVPGCVAIGWHEASKIPRSTLASLLILGAYVAIRLSGIHLPETVRLFGKGCIFMGAFVYYLGLLILSSRRFAVRRIFDEKGVRIIWRRYWVMQGITVVSGLAAFYLGATFGIGMLLGIGGTFFTLYLLEKYFEIPWRGVGWAWAALGVAVGLYFFVGFAEQNARFFAWGIR